jgi:hypothetical protein
VTPGCVFCCVKIAGCLVVCTYFCVQAMNLGVFPPMKVTNTDEVAEGQIYIGSVSQLIFWVCRQDACCHLNQGLWSQCGREGVYRRKTAVAFSTVLAVCRGCMLRISVSALPN